MMLTLVMVLTLEMMMMSTPQTRRVEQRIIDDDYSAAMELFVSTTGTRAGCS
jgi:hypothetical protein